MPGMSGVSGISVLPFGSGGGASFNIADMTFTPAMRKSPGAAGVFDAAPMVQGQYDMSGTADYIQMARGNLLGNALGYFYDNFDPYQGTILLWWTPEVSSADQTSGYTFLWYISAAYYARYGYAANSYEFRCGNVTVTRAAAMVAGTTYHVSCSWDTKNPIDGTNYIRTGLNDAYTYGGTGLTVSAPDAATYSGRNAMLEGVYYIRRVLYDGTYGTPSLDGADELAAIYAAGAGLDPSRVIGSWDTTFCMPTDSTPNEALVTGTGQAWSHPHSSSLPDVSFMSDGDPPGTPYAVEFNGTSTYVDCGSGATLDDIPNGGEITVGAWVRLDSAGVLRMIASKGVLYSSGWALYVNASGYVNAIAYLGTTNAATYLAVSIEDGKWHYVGFRYEDTGKTMRVFVDGIWTNAVAGAGAYQSEAAQSFMIGRRSDTGAWYWHGGIAWLEAWDNDHHTAGTNFIRPRAPQTPPVANLVETWWADEGTGATVAARVTTPANDGTITSGSWSRIWEQEGTPVIPASLEFAETAVISAFVAVGSGATIDDLPTGANGVTGEGWIRLDQVSTGDIQIFGKRFGWDVSYASGTDTIFGHVNYDTTDAYAYFVGCNLIDGVWHHIAMTYNENTDRKVYLFVDGILRAVSSASVGAYVTDAPNQGSFFDSGWTARTPAGALGWQHWSDTVRYTGTTIGQRYFNPAGRSNLPGADGNSMGHWAFNDGAGTTVTDTSGNANHGTISGTDHTWRDTTDMETESPGERAYPWGYAIGSDGANDGITIIEDAEVTAGVSYVTRVTWSVGMSSRAYPLLRVYDNTGAANIVDFYYPRMSGTHNGGAAAASLTDSGARWVINLAGWTVHNVTDGSKATITSNTETNIVGALAGGGSNDWNVGETYAILPPSDRPYGRNPVIESFVWTAPAGCSSVDMKFLNAAGEGVTHVHQVETYESLVPHGDCETLVGNPAIISGWANGSLAAGETLAEAVIVHSGAQSLEWVAAASGYNDAMFYWSINGAVGAFYAIGGWFWGDGGFSGIRHGSSTVARGVLHSDATINFPTVVGTARWLEIVNVYRAVQADIQAHLYAYNGAVALRYCDDLYVVALDDVSLTFGPASQANSLEPAPDYIRVDGEDQCALPAEWFGRSGSYSFRVIVRQDITIAGTFKGEDGVLLDIHFDANNYLYLRIRDAAATIRVDYNAAGAGVQTSDWNPGAQWEPQDELLIRLDYGPSGVRMWADGVLVINNANPCYFDAAPTTRVIGPGWGGGAPDIVIGAP